MSVLALFAVAEGASEATSIIASAALTVVLAFGAWCVVVYRAFFMLQWKRQRNKILFGMLVISCLVGIGLIYAYPWLLLVMPAGLLMLLAATAGRDFILPALIKRA